MTELLFISTAFFTAFAWAITQVMDKEVIDNHLSSAATVTFFTAVVSFLLGFVGVPLGKVGVPAMNSMFLLFLVGIAYTSATFLYMRALNFEDVGVVAVLQKIGSVFTVLLAVMVLGEKFTVVQFGGWLSSFQVFDWHQLNSQ
ncbi:MAG: EamA family transporter [Candidatus Nanosalina sp.]